MVHSYQFPYPDPATAAAHPFETLDFVRHSPAAMAERAADFKRAMERRRSVRMISDEPVPRHLIETAVATASTAPSGAHQQPWSLVATGDPALKHQIRHAAEQEERINYGVGPQAEGRPGRMSEEWRRELAPLGTDWHKEFLEVAPWVVVLFEQRYGVRDDGTKRHHYYVKESCGIAAGMFITALHHMGLVTLTHTPSPMAFLTKIFDRPENERPFVVFPIGFPVDGCRVPTLQRKSLDDVLTVL